MKKTLLTLYVLFRILLVEGSHLNSELVLRMQNGSYFTTSFDHNFYNSPVQSLHLAQVEPGKHFLQINELQFNGFYNNWFNHIVFTGYIDIPAATRVTAMIDNYGRFVVTGMMPLMMHAPVSYNPAPYSYGMSPSAFNHLQSILQNQAFDSAKLKIAKQAIATNKVSSGQVLQLMNLFTFESYKLDFAKFAYQHTIDKQNYFMLYDGFTFQSSISELARYTGQSNYFAWQ